MRRSPLSAVLGLAVLLLAGCATGAPHDAAGAGVPAGGPGADVATGSAEVRLHLLRHGENVLNAHEILGGWADGPLTPAGREQAAHAAVALADVAFVSAWTSDMVRTRETAAEVLARHPAAPGLQEDALLREWHFGAFEGESWEALTGAIRAADDPQVEPLPAGDASITALADQVAAVDPWGVAEDRGRVEQRAAAALDLVVEDAVSRGGGDVLVVTHGLILLTMLEVADPVAARPETPGNVALSRLVWRDGAWTIEAQNDVAHLEAAAPIA